MAKLEPLSQKWVTESEEKAELLKGAGISTTSLPAVARRIGSRGNRGKNEEEVARAWDVDPQIEEAEMV